MVFSNSTKDPNILGAEHFIHILPEFACQDPPLHELSTSSDLMFKLLQAALQAVCTLQPNQTYKKL
jgi:hypothetical protein